MSWKTAVALVLWSCILFLNCLPAVSQTTDSPVQSSAYVSNGSLTFANRTFYLSGQPLWIVSGSLHYFRVVPQYWWDRMRKMKACGLNTLSLYVPWNLHEQIPGQFNFDGMLNLRKFIQMADKAGLYVILRPGPYICSEWDFGGLPGWLLRDPNMKVRSNYHWYKLNVELYFNRMLREIVDLQYHRGGPIIAVQIENEFGSYSNETEHLSFLKQTLQSNGINEMFFTSDGLVNNDTVNGMDVAPFYQEALPMVNFQDIDKGERLMSRIEALSEDFPVMVAEYWSGWFDQWGDKHHTTSIEDFRNAVTRILNRTASINFYMFHGGTNFGFMAGANWDTEKETYKSDVTSYDYDALLTEAGDITEKYKVARDIIHKIVYAGAIPPDIPYDTPKKDWGVINIEHVMPFDVFISHIKFYKENRTIPMELLPLYSVENITFGQSYGFVLYRTNITFGENLTFTDYPRDRIQVLVDGSPLGVVEEMVKNQTISISSGETFPRMRTLDIIVENRGRVNYMTFGHNTLNEQRKGLNDNCFLDGVPIGPVSIYPLQFEKETMTNLSVSSDWQTYDGGVNKPALYRGYLRISNIPLDTYLSMKGWTKGIVFVNDFNIGRYWNKGPQQSLFVPAPILKQGRNEIIIAEEAGSSGHVEFQNQHVLDVMNAFG